MPDRRHQVGAHRLLGPLAAPYRLQGPGEDLGRQVVRGVRVPAAGAGVAAHGLRVAPEQLVVREVVALAHALDQLRVRRTRGGTVHGTGAAPRPLHRHGGNRLGGARSGAPGGTRRTAVLDRRGRPGPRQDRSACVVLVGLVAGTGLARHLVPGRAGRSVPPPAVDTPSYDSSLCPSPLIADAPVCAIGP